MIVATVSLALKIRRYLMVSVICPTLLFGFDLFASPNEPLTLYLPAINQQDKDLAKKLETEFRRQGLELLQVRGTAFWHPYQNGIRTGKKGIYFAQPHLAAWAISQHEFEPIFRLHGRLNFVLATNKANTTLFELEDLNGKKICHESGLNLGRLWLEDVLGEYLVAANRQEVANVENTIGSAIESKDCDAFVLENRAYERANNASRGKFIRLAQSPFYNHSAFVAHPTLTHREKSKLIKALKSTPIKLLLQPYLLNLSKWENLIEVNEGDYTVNNANILKTYWRQ